MALLFTQTTCHYGFHFAGTPASLYFSALSLSSNFCLSDYTSLGNQQSMMLDVIQSEMGWHRLDKKALEC